MKNSILGDLKNVADEYAKQQRSDGAVISPKITNRSPGVVLKKAQERAAEIRRDD